MDGLVGYRLCRRCNQEWVVAEVARRTGYLCEQCIDLAIGSLREVELRMGRGSSVKVRRRQCDGSRGSEVTRRDSEKAREAARRRLARIMPALYEILVADERRRRGLEAWPVEMATPRMNPDDFDQELRLATSRLFDVYASGDAVAADPPHPR